jgi:alkaline phosphatase D
MGDTIYGDGLDPAGLRDAYRALSSKPEFRRFRDNVPIVAMWDDHDFGANDSGADYRWAKASKEIFLDFFGEPRVSARRERDGLHAAYLFGPPGANVHLIAPDLRTHRDRLRVRNLGGRDYGEWATSFERAGLPVPGPYDRHVDAGPSMLDERQWSWLERQMSVPASIKVFASSLQVLADFTGWEAWANFPNDRRRLIDMIRRRRAEGVIFVSGDTHYGEISKVEAGAPYPLWDATSSGLTEVWPVTPPNNNRVGRVHRGINFGTLTIDRHRQGTDIVACVHGHDGGARIAQVVPLSDLAPREA